MPKRIEGEGEEDDLGKRVSKAYFERLDQLMSQGKYPLYPDIDNLTAEQATEEILFPLYIFNQVAKEHNYKLEYHIPDEILYPWQRVEDGVRQKVDALRHAGNWPLVDRENCSPEERFTLRCHLEVVIQEICVEVGVGLPPGRGDFTKPQ